MEMNLDSGGNSSFLNLNHWEQQSSAAADPHDAHFESALSSLASSPISPSSSPTAGCNIPPDSIVIRELIGRLGSICNNNHCNSRGSLTPHVINYQCSNDNTSTSSSCYTTPLSSPPKLNLISFPQFPPPTMGAGLGFVTDPGFAERAARYSCFGVAGNYAQFGEPGKLSRASSSQSLSGQLENNMMLTRMRRTTTLMARPGEESGLNINNSDPRDDSSPLDPIMTPCESEGNVVRKRKATFSSSSSSRRSKGNDARHNPPKVSEEENSNSKRCKSSSGEPRPEADKDAVKAPKVEQNNSAAEKQNEKDKESNAKPPEPPKQDYIHVRARRGQATDSHSLAERVRREKISERMKFLQDLVPGCNKVTGKAVMLDEIINYVQSLQRQVEFLSMKLATVNPLVDSVLTKDMHQPRGLMLLPHSSYQLEAMGSSGFSYANLPEGHGPALQSLMASNALETELDASMQAPSFDGFTDATSAPQLGAFWEDDLHSVVQMGFVQNQEAAFSSQNLQGSPSHTKIEL